MKVPKIPPAINYVGLPLFDWASAGRCRPRVTYPAQWLRQRHPLSPDRAALLVRLAGFGGEE
jgi:hypothetical protein